MKKGVKAQIIKKTLIIWLPAVIILIAAATIFYRYTALKNEKFEIAGRPYTNEDLKFSLVLPFEFEYFQTQRKNMQDYTDLEIFIPTSDREYPQEVPGYAKPLVIGVLKKDEWEKREGKDENDAQMELVGSKGDIFYAVKFWNYLPSEWQARWSDVMKDNIIKSIKIE
jgi:hypothetical protein